MTKQEVDFIVAEAIRSWKMNQAFGVSWTQSFDLAMDHVETIQVSTDADLIRRNALAAEIYRTFPGNNLPLCQ